MGRANLGEGRLEIQGDSRLPASPLGKPALRSQARSLPLNVNMQLEDDQVLVTFELSVRLPLETLQDRFHGASGRLRAP